MYNDAGSSKIIICNTIFYFKLHLFKILIEFSRILRGLNADLCKDLYYQDHIKIVFDSWKISKLKDLGHRSCQTAATVYDPLCQVNKNITYLWVFIFIWPQKLQNWSSNDSVLWTILFLNETIPAILFQKEINHALCNVIVVFVV